MQRLLQQEILKQTMRLTGETSFTAIVEESI
jgi:hypothetical protein